MAESSDVSAVHPLGFSRTGRVAVNWVAPGGRVQAVGKSYRKQISLHVKMEGAASVGSENLILWGGGRWTDMPAQSWNTLDAFEPDEHQSMAKP